MAYRSQSKRLLRPSRFALVAAALVAPLVAGCQSNVQQDLIAREMRMQEDQIYAMEDYLAQYQDLVCKYRTENAALRRQLGEVEDTAAPARPSPRTRNGPAIEAPRPSIDDTPPQELDLPDVPPLEETTSRDELRLSAPAAGGEIALASGHSATHSASARHTGALEPATEQAPIHGAWLHGEVVENDTGGGPRLVVEIEPQDEAGRPAPFVGPLSLMLLATDGDGEASQQSLARWDFSPHDVQSAIDAAKGDHAIRFYLELPAETPITDPTEIWVRLLPRGGEKVLAHAAIDLQEPSQFTSIPRPPPPTAGREERPTVAVIHGKSSSIPSPMPSNFVDAGWTTARPGEPAVFPGDANDAGGQWRASSEPLPRAIAASTTRRSKPPRRRSSPPVPRSAVSSLVEQEDRSPSPDWSPDRPAGSSAGASRTATGSTRPSWSATR